MLRLTAMLGIAATLAAAAVADDGGATLPRPVSAGGRPHAPIGEIGRRIAAAHEGETVVIGPGVYREHVRIDKRLTLVGSGRPVIDGGGNGDIVEITAPGVEFRGFTVRDTGIDLDKENAAVRVLAGRVTIEDNILEDILFGIDLREAPDCIVRNNHIGGKALDIARRGDGLRLWRSDRTLVERNDIHDGRDAILWYSQDVTVRANTSSRCRYGFHLMYSDSVVIEDNELTENSVGVYLMYSKRVRLDGNRIVRNRGPSGYGVGLKEVDQFTVVNNVIGANRVGVYLDGSPFSTVIPGGFSKNTIAFNDIGIAFLPSVRGNRFTENNFIDNIEQVAILGRGELKGNEFSHEGRGNFWTDYVGYDQDRDGIGDFVHESQTLFENMLDKEPKLRILLFSPVQQAVELVGRALPATRPEPKFSDEFPLMTSVADAGGTSREPLSTGALAGAGGSLIAVGAAVFLLAGHGPNGSNPRRPRTNGGVA